MVEERVNGLRKGEGGTGELGLRVICARWRGWGMPSISHVTLTLEVHNIITYLAGSWRLSPATKKPRRLGESSGLGTFGRLRMLHLSWGASTLR